MTMRALFLVLCLCACSRPAPPPLLSPPPESPTWFVCDALDAPILLQVDREGSAVRIVAYDKPSGALASRTTYNQGPTHVAGASAYTSLLIDNLEVGAIRETNPSGLENPGAAFTPRIIEVRLGERAFQCRWLSRTRMFAFTGRRTLVVHEDADGDLIYTAYDFQSAAEAAPVALSENSETTTFSVEVRGGREVDSPSGVEFTFTAADGIAYAVTLQVGAGRLDVLQDGSVIQSEPLLGIQTGSGPRQ